MRKLLSLSLILALFSMAVLAKPLAKKKVVEEPVDLLQKVSGFVFLLAKKKGIDSDSESLFIGGDTKLNASKKGKKVKVEGDYNGGSSVNVTEAEAAPSAPQYSFTLPVVGSVLSTYFKRAKESLKFGSVSATFATPNQDSGSEPVIQPSVTSVFNIAKNVSKEYSIKKVVVTRKGNKAIAKGAFGKGAAKGRFKLKFAVQ